MRRPEDRIMRLPFALCFPVLLGIGFPAVAADVTFEKDVRPILKAACFHCHGEEEKPKGKLDVRLPSLLVKGGKSGSALVPGKPDESALWERIANDEMPEGSKKLSPAQKDIIKRWIADGAKSARPEPKNPDDLHITEEERQFWAFQPIQKPPVPNNGATHPIDAFVQQQLNAQKLTPNPLADRRTLIRRATLDLTGLLPTPDEVQAFVADRSPNAYEKLLDRLLASPQYGEHWGRHWLDVAGYAESDGVTNTDKVRPHAWKYRDYVVRAFNTDKPFDVFLQEQLAGDELVGKRPGTDFTPAEVERLTATGFLRMAPDGTDIENTLVERNNTVAETIKIVGSAFLGLTVGCAQCHDHRYDPITIGDYYRLRAIFDPAFDLKKWQTPTQRLINLTPKDVHERRASVEAEAVRREKVIRDDEIKQEDAIFEKEILKIPEAERAACREAFFAEKKTPAQNALLKKYTNLRIRHTIQLYDPKAYQELKKRRAEVAVFRETKPPEQFLPVCMEPTTPPPESFILFRGDHESPKGKVQPGELAILALHRPTNDIAPKPSTTTQRRLAYARLLTDGTHPLTARVAVNRVWLHHFGRGIVATPGDFGAFGERPTHPELLDWLATDFMAHGWHMKRLHKLIMLSETYQRTATRTVALQADPDNKWLARANVRRLTAEQIRDALLAVTGQLRLEVGGPSVPVVEDLEGMPILGRQKYNEGLLQGTEAVGDQEFRRTLYIQVRRKLPLAMLDAFDLPVLKPNCESRRFTTVAPQSLLFMNNQFILKQADMLANRLQREATTPEAQVQQAWLLLYGAAPTANERSLALNFLAEQTTLLKDQPKAPSALANLCQVLLGSNRFLYVD